MVHDALMEAFIVVCPFIPFPLSIVLSGLLRYTDSDYPFGIFKLFLYYHFVFLFVTILVVHSLLPDILYGSWYLFGFSLILVRKGRTQWTKETE
jgi:hypothetical protein